MSGSGSPPKNVQRNVGRGVSGSRSASHVRTVVAVVVKTVHRASATQAMACSGSSRSGAMHNVAPEVNVPNTLRRVPTKPMFVTSEMRSVVDRAKVVRDHAAEAEASPTCVPRTALGGPVDPLVK
ncbi:unannotated protein [freshwater metagenome]|uniref:Unannotated protein n=1 Tax=freshwater metagenome TaxID=449393 RepID=A0A6J7HH05_9ZZZZ